MGFLSDEKHKNDSPRRFQWWLLVIGFGLGVLAMLIVSTANTSTNSITNSAVNNPDELYITATYLIQQATATAQAVSVTGENQLSEMQATASAQALFVADENQLGEVQATATYIIQMATQQAEAATAQASTP